MGTIITLLAIPSMFIAPISGWMTFSFFREGDTSSAAKAGAVFAVTAFLLVAGHINGPGPSYTSGDCYTAWDGRGNPAVCD